MSEVVDLAILVTYNRRELFAVRMAAAMANEPRWLKSSHISGLDHPGVQVLSIAIYGDLLPGITNATNRIRYYSFYPWLLHRYALDVKSIDTATWQNHLRRAEFLLALIGGAHHADESEGGEALVGADQASKALVEIRAQPRKAWRLSQWADVAKAGQPGSYFKNKNGGFGQYYRGQLAGLGLIHFSTDSLGIKLSKGKGTEIAELCDSQPGRAGFWKMVIDDKFSFERIVALGDSLCPCQTCRDPKEHQFLIELMFGPDTLATVNTFSRADTLRLLLAFLKNAGEPDDPVPDFRNIAYYEHNEDGKRFKPPPPLAEVFRKWFVYEACEYAHYSLEVAFDALLHHMAESSDVTFNANEFINKTAKSALSMTSTDLRLGTRKSNWCDRTLGDIMEEAEARQKPIGEWRVDPWSEDNLIGDLATQPPLERMARAFACLVALFSRKRLPDQPFQIFPSLTTDRLVRHRVTISGILQFLTDRVDIKADAVLAELLKNHVVGQHLHIAMRKLRNDSQSTFKLTIENGRLIWQENFQPVFTNPRLTQAFRFLRDLGFCSGRKGGWKLTDKGKEQLRSANGN